MTQFDAERNEIIFLIRFLRFMCKSLWLPETGTFLSVDADIDTLLGFHATREIPPTWEQETFSPLLRDVARQTQSEFTCPTDIFCCWSLMLFVLLHIVRKSIFLSPSTYLVAIGVWQKTSWRFFFVSLFECIQAEYSIYIHFHIIKRQEVLIVFFVTTESRLHHTRDKNKRKSNSSNCC